jgi:uncharacterized integral membrane protein (TIGR00698 family)
MDASAQTSTNPQQGASNNPAIAAPPWTAYLLGIAPGLFLTMAIAAAAFALRAIPGLALASPMILAIAIGIAVNAIVGTPVLIRAGIVFVLRRILRLAIILLGLQLTVGQIFAVGTTGISIILVTLVATFVFTVWLGRILGVERGLTELIAAGTAICGASAIIATNTVTRARGEDAAYAVACVTVLGSIAMFVYPVLGTALNLDSHGYGLWAGASIHEVAQVLAAAFQGGQEAGELGTIAKLSRVIALGPLIMVLALIARRRSSDEGFHAEAPVPWFVLGFIALILVNSFVAIPADTKAAIGTLTTFMLTMAMAAMGIQTDMRQLRARGMRPLILGFGAAIFIAGLSLTLVLLFV